MALIAKTAHFELHSNDEEHSERPLLITVCVKNVPVVNDPDARMCVTHSCWSPEVYHLAIEELKSELGIVEEAGTRLYQRCYKMTSVMILHRE